MATHIQIAVPEKGRPQPRTKRLALNAHTLGELPNCAAALLKAGGRLGLAHAAALLAAVKASALPNARRTALLIETEILKGNPHWPEAHAGARAANILPAHGRRAWSQAETQTLIDLANQGRWPKQIAQVLGRTPKAVARKREKLGLRGPSMA